MLKNYLKIAFRNLLQQKGYSFINIFGLSVGVSACMLIAAYVISEYSYDKNHPDSEQIYRINTEFNFPDQQDKIARNSVPFAPQLAEDYPIVKSYLRIFQTGKQTVTYENKMFNETNISYADSTLFRFFNYKIVQGNKYTALSAPGTVIISEKKAEFYFGSAAEAMDKIMRFQNSEYRVAGVFNKDGIETHLPFDFFISFASVPQSVIDQAMQDYMWLLTFTYIKINKGVSKKSLDEALNSFYEKRVTPWLKENNVQGKFAYNAQPLTGIHLSTSFSYDYATNSNPVYITIFLTAGFFILIIACFNYFNLITARSMRRSKEVGMRKVLGAKRGQLILQFLGESTLLTLFAFILGFALTSILVNPFNELTGKNFSEESFFNYEIFLPLIGIFLFISLAAGSYPSLYLSKFKPTSVLKINALAHEGNKIFTPANLRKLLVVLQFAISLILIIETIVIFKQFSFMKNKELGFNKEQVFVIDIPNDTSVSKNLQTIKNELLKNHAVVQAAASSHVPGNLTGTLYFNVDQQGQMQDKFLNFIFIDDEYLDLMGIKIKEGRNFSKEITTDQQSAFIINETAAAQLNWTEPLGKKMKNGLGKDGVVVGVIKDYNYSSLHNPISPLVMMYAPVTQGFLLVKVSPANLPGTIDFIQSKWRNFDPNHPLEYFFLDESFEQIYIKEKNLISIFGYFALLAIIISCMGLFGLASYIAEQKTKEIGVRKVLGATVPDIAALLSKNFLKLVLISNIIAIPAAYYGMNKWLEDFAYRVDVDAWTFLLAALSAFLIAFFTVSYQAVKAASANPVKSLRYE